MNKKSLFLDSFPFHVYRYIDGTGNGRKPVVSFTLKPEINEKGYDSYFTVNGFFESNDQTIENLTNINAFFVDIDGRKDLEELESIKKLLCPTFILETMNGYHVYWLLDEPIFKNEITSEEWDKNISEWTEIENSLVKTLNGDENAKDIARILRVPDTYYWKKSGDLYKKGINAAPFKIKGIFKDLSKRYSFTQMKEVFSPIIQKMADEIAFSSYESKNAEKEDFFNRVNAYYPIETRDSFIKIISGTQGTIPEGVGRNQMLLVAGSLMRQAGQPLERAISEIKGNGWHGMAAERGGMTEIENTLRSAYRGKYAFSKNNPVIEHNASEEERGKMKEVYAKVFKERKEIEKLFFSTYEQVLMERYPHIVKNEANIYFEYQKGVYREITKQEIIDRIINEMEYDMLWAYRTARFAHDKFVCWTANMKTIKVNEDENILNVKNGLLNLVTKELKPHTSEYISLYQMPVEYDPNMQAPIWDGCIKAWTLGAEQNEKIRLLQQYAGYCLTPSMMYSTVLFLVGDGGNGKSTFSDTLKMLIGKDGTSSFDLEQINERFGSSGLLGKRLNLVEEVSGNYYQAHKLKRMVSGEDITAEKKNHPHFTFTPTAKFIFAVNEMPRVDDSSQASERRMAIVLFNNNFRENPNVKLRFKTGLLAGELSGILNWAVEGLNALRKMEGFIKTDEQKNALKDYREENSSVDGFIGECLNEEEGKVAETSVLYAVYSIFCKNTGLKPQSRIRFTKHLKSYGNRTGKFAFMERDSNKSQNRFEGIDIREEWALKDNNYAYQNYGK